MAKKLTRRQRLKLIDPVTRTWVEGLDEEMLLALHDLTHDEMDARGEIAAAARKSQMLVEIPSPVLASQGAD